MGKILWTFLASCLASSVLGQIVNPYGPSIALGPTTTHGVNVPISDWYTWESPLTMTGNGWGPNEVLQVHLKGPLNTLGVAQSDRIIGQAIADPHGILTTFTQYGFLAYPNMVIPFNEITPSPATDDSKIPEPGYYILEADGPNSNLPPWVFLPPDSASVNINIGPDGISTYSGVPFVFNGWPRDRGARVGFLDGLAEGNSPEKADPEWPSVWNDKPVAMYATVAPTLEMDSVDDPPANQPSFITHADLPFTHYGHDVNMELLPDPDYLWLLGSGNFFSETVPGKANFGRMECEWETQNNGRPVYGSYGRGNIGMPLFVTPSVGDRVYIVGRWVLDNGHPDGGDRTEIHPARMLATMRQRMTATPFLKTAAMTRAQQVDVYVSGHGGGANLYPDGLSNTEDWRGGGGILQDSIDAYAQDVYYGFGPSTSDLYQAIAKVLGYFVPGGINVLQAAGPSGLGWGAGPENRPLYDMDYAFDVPLPPAPRGATAPEYNVTIQPWHTTQVQESVSYTNYVNGLPTTAHIILPWLGVQDSGIYAKTFKFYWNVFSEPGKHFQVRINNLATPVGGPVSVDNVPYYANAGPLYMWTDVCGQWASLTDADPGMSVPFATRQPVQTWTALFADSAANGTHAVKFDVFLDSSDTMRVFTLGYGARDFDKLFGVDVGKPAYDAGLDLADAQVLGSGQNMNLGGAVFQAPISNSTELQAVLGSHQEYSFLQAGSRVKNFYGYPLAGPPFTMDFTVSYVPRPPVLTESGLPMNFGTVLHGTKTSKTFQIKNTGETALYVSSFTVAGAAFGSSSSGSFIVPPGQTITGSLTFSPPAVGSFTGVVTIQSDDPLHPTLKYALSGKGS